MRHIEIVAKAFAIVEDKVVIGVVTAINETQYAFYPLVPGKVHGVDRNVPLQYALETGLKFERTE